MTTNKKDFAKREKTLARLVVNDRQTLEEISSFINQSREWTARLIVFGAYLIKEKNPRAAKLASLALDTAGQGAIKAIKIFLTEEKK